MFSSKLCGRYDTPTESGSACLTVRASSGNRQRGGANVVLEQLYCEALATEFELRNIPFVAQMPCQILYKDRPLTGFYKIDFICFENIVVEVKAVSALTPADEAQILNYLALAKHRLGLSLNFRSSRLSTVASYSINRVIGV
jgi:GxxExxY protein